MYFWRDKYFETLKEIANEAERTPEWRDYAAYCAEYERGLRRQAFSVLERFIVAMVEAPFQERRRFVSWLLHLAEGREGHHMLVPHPLYKRLVEPTLNEWTVIEPTCSEPHRWLGGYEHLKRALELDPTDQLARANFIRWIIGRVQFSTHELPAGFLGVPGDDLKSLDEAQAALAELADKSLVTRFASEIIEERELITEYLRCRQIKNASRTDGV